MVSIFIKVQSYQRKNFARWLLRVGLVLFQFPNAPTAGVYMDQWGQLAVAVPLIIYTKIHSK